MNNGSATLGELWRVRNAAAATLELTEAHMQRAVKSASLEDLIILIESFAPGQATGPEWTRTFEPLAERLWAWRDDATLAALALTFRTRGVPWAAVTNALSPEQGARSRDTLRHPAWARLPAFGTA